MIFIKNMNLGKDSIIKLFFYFFIPNFCSMIALATYSMVDGIFVGKAIGDRALAAIGICWPVFPVLIAIELLFSIGAASIASYYIGKNKPIQACRIFSANAYFLLTISMLVGLFLYFNIESLAYFLGANEEILELVVDYLRVIVLGGFIMIFHPFLDIFAINDKRPILAMVAMIVGSCANIILNYCFLFVLQIGIAGAALSTIMGHSIGACILLAHFLRKKGQIYFVRFFAFRTIFRSLKNGVSSFFAEISAGIVMICFNHRLETLGGVHVISTYSILLYISSIAFTTIIAIANTMQPISSFNYGAKLKSRVKQIYLFVLVFAFIIGLFIFVGSRYFDEEIALLFLREDSIFLLGDIKKAMHIYMFGYVFLGFNLCSSTFLQSLQRPLGAFIITCFANLFFILALLYSLSYYFGIAGVWASYPVSLILASVVSFFVMLIEWKKGVLSKVW